MNARVRMMADARSLFGPWCAVAAAGILSLLTLHRLPGGLEPDVIAGFGFCIGIPLLATLTFGNEFQFGTISSLLSQPIERSRIWQEKSAVIVVSVLSAAIAYGFGAHQMGWKPQAISIAALWLMVTVGSSAYWTLLARSTIGGLVLNGLQSIALALAFVPQLNKRPQPLLAIAGFAIAYTALMLYLGRRRLLRFEATGGAGSSSNLLATDWALRSNPLRRLLQCTASGGTLNLVRKEMHLLWPLAPLTLIAFGMLLAVAPLRWSSAYQSWIWPAGVSIILIHGFLAATLAGALSLGEERSLGLHTWNMTQPVSARRQWVIKLVIALFASAISSGAVLIAAKTLLGPAFLPQAADMFVGGRALPFLTFIPLLTFAAFWCATAVKGTVRASFWCFPAGAAVLTVYAAGIGAGQMRTVVEVVRALMEAVHPFPFTGQLQANALNLTWFQQQTALIPALWLYLWLLPPAAIQSYRLFRSEIREGVTPLIRRVLVLAAIALLCGFLQTVPAVVTGTTIQNTVRVLGEVSQAVAAMQIDPTTARREGPFVMSVETLSNTGLSDRTRAWLATDTLVIRAEGIERYTITADLHAGWKCTFTDNLFEALRINRGMGMFGCKSPHGTLGWLTVDSGAGTSNPELR